MKTRKTLLIVLVIVLLLGIGGYMLYRYFVSNQIKDGGTGMENPNTTVNGKELVEFNWILDSSVSNDNFDLSFYIEDETPMVKGFFYDENKQINLSSLALTWSKWFELQSILAQTSFISSNINNDNKITIVWSKNGNKNSETYDGSNQEELQDKVITIIKEVYNQ